MDTINRVSSSSIREKLRDQWSQASKKWKLHELQHALEVLCRTTLVDNIRFPGEMKRRFEQQEVEPRKKFIRRDSKRSHHYPNRDLGNVRRDQKVKVLNSNGERPAYWNSDRYGGRNDENDATRNGDRYDDKYGDRHVKKNNNRKQKDKLWRRPSHSGNTRGYSGGMVVCTSCHKRGHTSAECFHPKSKGMNVAERARRIRQVRSLQDKLEEAIAVEAEQEGYIINDDQDNLEEEHPNRYQISELDSGEEHSNQYHDSELDSGEDQ